MQRSHFTNTKEPQVVASDSDAINLNPNLVSNEAKNVINYN